MSMESLPPAHPARRKAAQRSARPRLPLIVIVVIPVESEPARDGRRAESLLHERPEHALLLHGVQLHGFQLASLQAPFEGALEQARFAFLARLARHGRARLRRGNALRCKTASGEPRRSASPEQRPCPGASDLAIV